jgi:hypothetical protein
MRRFSCPFAVLAAAAAVVFAAPAGADAPPPAAQAVTITVQPGARQTFHGLGTGQFDGTYHTLPPERRQLLARLIYRDLHMKSLRLWWSMREYSPSPGVTHPEEFAGAYVASHIIADAKASGVTTLLLGPFDPPLYMLEDPSHGDSHLKASEVKNYAALMADFIQTLRNKYGVVINVTGIANEPPWFTPETMAAEVAALRAALNARGLAFVGIVAHEAPNNDDVTDDFLRAMKNDPAAWRGLLGIATHSYNMSARQQEAGIVAGTGKQFWITEAGGGGPEGPNDGRYAASLAARYFNDMNHGVTHWMWFLGAVDVGDWPVSADNSQRLIEFQAGRPADWYLPFLPYYYLRQISDTFDAGCVFRQSRSSEDGDMLWTEAPKPPLVAAAAKNPDGTWGIGLVNYTSDKFDGWDSGGFHAKGQPARFFRVTVRVPELAAENTVFDIKRSSESVRGLDEGHVVMRHGTLTVALAPLEMLTLHSLPKTKKVSR